MYTTYLGRYLNRARVAWRAGSRYTIKRLKKKSEMDTGFRQS